MLLILYFNADPGEVVIMLFGRAFHTREAIGLKRLKALKKGA